MNFHLFISFILIFLNFTNIVNAQGASPQLGNITKYCLGEGSDTTHKTATTLCLPWDKQISAPISGVGRSVGAHYCCEICNSTDSWANTCYRPVDKNKNSRGPNETTCEVNAGVAFPLKCKTDPTDNVLKWISQNDVGECNTICAVTGLTVTPSNTPAPGQPTNTPTPTPTVNPNTCALSSLSPAMTQDCTNCLYAKRTDLQNLKNGAPQNCSINQVITHWCNGGTSPASKTDCNTWKTDTTKCGKPEYKCDIVAPSPTPNLNNPIVNPDCTVIPSKLLSDKCSLCMFDSLKKATVPLTPNNLCNASQNVISYCKDGPTILICLDMFKKECLIQCSLPDILIIGKSYSNNSYEKIMDNYKKGEISAIEISAYITAANRVPGIQMRYCDPHKGECDLIMENLL